MRRLILIGLLSFTASALAQNSSPRTYTRITPTFGSEQSVMRYPAPPRVSTRTFFGIGVQYGRPLLAGEAEAQLAHGTRTYSTQKVKDDVTRASLGLRTTNPATSFFSVYSRSGVRTSWQRSEIKDTTTGQTEKKSPPATYDPYAGGGLEFHLSSVGSFNAGATWYFPQGGGEPSLQYAFGVTLAGL
mgnify:CR=1 FL=1